MAPNLLHGTLDVTVFGIDKLYYGCNYYFCNQNMGPQQLGKKLLGQVKRYVLCNPSIIGTQIYATVDLDKARVARTRIIKDERYKPEWAEDFRIYCAHFISHIIFTVKDADPVGATLIGRAYVPVEDVLKGFIVDRWVEIVDEELYPVSGNSKIHVKLRFSSVTHHENWSRGIQSPSFEGVRDTFFLQRHGCKVTLYKDAHVKDDFNPPMLLPGEVTYEPHRCWEDIFDAISNAQKLIYITGWSVYAEITLVRDPNRPKPEGNLKLGELLKKKAEEGVTVLMLVWDDRTSVKELKRDGLMATHDQETANYFKDTKVKCILCPRNPDHGESYVEKLEIFSMFTHHQKTVIVDNEGPGNNRRIVSFVGGIDLCDGRYDAQDHPLFKTLDSIHLEDFHQPNFPGSSIQKGGPREPWHDIHCKLEGPVAWDVLYNFEQRWERQVSNKDDKQLLIPREKLHEFAGQPQSPLTNPDDAETWNVQIFRSIDGGAVINFPRDPHQAAKIGLVTATDSVFDRSIQDAYINAIRLAKNFIYIENQYFIGSSFAWKKTSEDFKPENIGALHLVPRELSLKLVSKIEAGERFTVYIVIPMWPEGVPESESVQAILDWQKRTIEMMYVDVTSALKKKNLKTDPREYLTFFCVGNRESKKPGEYVPQEEPEPNSDYFKAQQHRRFMVYVHAKMMIVDDEYIIIGSANINQRSMDGARDTEIAMGAYQPHHLDTNQQPARGQIFAFRMALWQEHLGRTDAVFHYPHSLRCVETVNSIANDLWNSYSNNDELNQDLPGHLLRYPIAITRDGGITNLSAAVKDFPDTKASVLGTRSEFLKPILTT